MDAERAFAQRLGGSCQSPIAAHARLEGRRLILEGLVAEPDGSRVLRDTPGREHRTTRRALGRELAERILAAGAGSAARASARRLTMNALHGVGVLVTRPEQQAMPLCRLLEIQGASHLAPARH